MTDDGMVIRENRMQFTFTISDSSRVFTAHEQKEYVEGARVFLVWESSSSPLEIIMLEEGEGSYRIVHLNQPNKGFFWTLTYTAKIITAFMKGFKEELKKEKETNKGIVSFEFDSIVLKEKVKVYDDLLTPGLGHRVFKCELMNAAGGQLYLGRKDGIYFLDEVSSNLCHNTDLKGLFIRELLGEFGKYLPMKEKES